MSTRQTPADSQLHRGSLGVAGIVFTVLAFVTPIGAVVGIVPLAIGMGNGVGVPGAYVAAGVVLLCFAAGYAAMSRHVNNAGAFYAYIARGLGRPAGVAAAFVSVVSYNAIACLVAAAFGFFANLVVHQQLHVDVPWPVWTAAVLGVIAVLGRRKVEVSAALLGLALVVECLILLVLDVAILTHQGLSAFTVHSFAPGTVFSGAIGVTLVFAFNNYIGFEATAIFGEEARDPHRTIPQATYVAVVVITVFYAITTWALIAGAGGAHAPAAAAADPGGFVFGLNERYVGHLATVAMQWLVLSSLFAALLATHNGTARYLFSLGRDGLLPRPLARTRAKTGAPHVASAIQVAITAAVLAAFAAASSDPITVIVPLTTGVGTLGIVLLQGGTAVSVVAFFRRRRDRRWLSTFAAPLIGAAGLISAAVLILDNYPVLTGHDSGLINQLPWLLAVAAAAGFGFAFWLRVKRPQVYANLAGSQDEVPVSPPAASIFEPAVVA
jgi:amino acid transporter